MSDQRGDRASAEASDAGGGSGTVDRDAGSGSTDPDAAGATDGVEGGADDGASSVGVEGSSATAEASGRPYLLGAAAVVTLFVAAASYVVAANNAVEAVTVFGLVSLPGSPPAMAAYGATLALLILGTLFGLVSVASRLDDDAV